jgi:hypothetical protein
MLVLRLAEISKIDLYKNCSVTTRMCESVEKFLDKFLTKFLIKVHTEIFTDLMNLKGCFRIGAAHFLYFGE